jgi:hypothetical protein
VAPKSKIKKSALKSLALVIGLIMLAPTSQAIMGSSTSYQLESADFTNGSSSGSSTNYNLDAAVIGDNNDGSIISHNYQICSGFTQEAFATCDDPAPPAPPEPPEPPIPPTPTPSNPPTSGAGGEFGDPSSEGNPENPEQPQNPTEPTEPQQPTQPTQPTEPQNPSDPLSPNQPVSPNQPGQPDAPLTPVRPVAPQTPLQPGIIIPISSGLVFPSIQNNIAAFNQIISQNPILPFIDFIQGALVFEITNSALTSPEFVLDFNFNRFNNNQIIITNILCFHPDRNFFDLIRLNNLTRLTEKAVDKITNEDAIKIAVLLSILSALTGYYYYIYWMSNLYKSEPRSTTRKKSNKQ